MSPELDKALCDKYPEIFADRYAPASQTAMCWGFDCGDGWYAIIDTLCQAFMEDVGLAKIDYETACEMRQRIEAGLPVSKWAQTFYTAELCAQLQHNYKFALAAIPRAVQVKEKFGELRFYVAGCTEKQQLYIDMAEALSRRTCEYCGTTKDAHVRRGSNIKTLCRDCATQYGYEVESVPITFKEHTI